jgi:nucleobase transporter 1/2
VGSRRVVQVGAVIMMCLAVFGKFGALFTTIPQPIVGGMYCAMFGMITSVGLSNLQFVDLNSARNLFIIGFSLFMGLSVPEYFANHPFSSGPEWFSNIVNTLGNTGMAIGAVVALGLDNTIPGTPEERGLTAWGAD